jgi:hypothetical protein
MFTHNFATTQIKTGFFVFPIAALEGSLRVTAQDLGYEIDQDELAAGMAVAAETQSEPITDATSAVAPEDFETIYTWFAS